MIKIRINSIYWSFSKLGVCFTMRQNRIAEAARSEKNKKKKRRKNPTIKKNIMGGRNGWMMAARASSCCCFFTSTLYTHEKIQEN